MYHNLEKGWQQVFFDKLLTSKFISQHLSWLKKKLLALNPP